MDVRRKGGRSVRRKAPQKIADGTNEKDERNDQHGHQPALGLLGVVECMRGEDLKGVVGDVAGNGRADAAGTLGDDAQINAQGEGESALHTIEMEQAKENGSDENCGGGPPPLAEACLDIAAKEQFFRQPSEK